MGAKIRINPMATEDLKEIKKYISEDNAEMAIIVVTDLIGKIESLVRFPEVGTMLMYKIGLLSRYRYVLCRQYLIFYLYEDDTVSIQRILHGKRDYLALLKE